VQVRVLPPLLPLSAGIAKMSRLPAATAWLASTPFAKLRLGNRCALTLRLLVGFGIRREGSNGVVG
jgi:hypothetical protein